MLCGILTLVSQRQFRPTSYTHHRSRDYRFSSNRRELDGLWIDRNEPTRTSSSGALDLALLDTQELRSLVSNDIACDDNVRQRLQIPIARFQFTAARYFLMMWIQVGQGTPKGLIAPGATTTLDDQLFEDVLCRMMAGLFWIENEKRLMLVRES